MELVENGRFPLFVQMENGNSNFLENRKRKFIFLGKQTINGNRQLLF
jgi:hypothetical protein